MLPALLLARLIASRLQAVQVPKQLCDDRVKTLQADVTRLGSQQLLKLSQVGAWT